MVATGEPRPQFRCPEPGVPADASGQSLTWQRGRAQTEVGAEASLKSVKGRPYGSVVELLLLESAPPVLSGLPWMPLDPVRGWRALGAAEDVRLQPWRDLVESAGGGQPRRGARPRGAPTRSPRQRRWPRRKRDPAGVR